MKRLVEHFTLRERRERAAKIDAPARDAMARQLRLAQQKGAAGECLWSHGHTAEGLRLSRDAFTAAREGAERLRGVEDDAELRVALARHGSSARAIGRVERAEKMAAAELPTTDADVGPEQAAAYRAVTKGRRDLEAALRYPTMSVGELRRTVIGRWIAAAVVIAAVVVAVLYVAFPPPVEEARASSTFGGATSVYPPSLILDGDPISRWLLPDNTPGWIEVTLAPSRSLTKVRFLNTGNPPWHDRATRAYRLEVFSPDGELVHASEGEFEEFEREPQWREVSMNVPDAARVRFTIKTHHGKSGGLCEMAFEE